MVTMAKKKELDNLSLDMIRCKADGFGCHYGDWKANHASTKANKDDSLSARWLICQRCGRQFKPKTRRDQKYCDMSCQREAQCEKDREKHNAYNRKRMAEIRERERKLRNESNA